MYCSKLSRQNKRLLLSWLFIGILFLLIGFCVGFSVGGADNQEPVNPTQAPTKQTAITSKALPTNTTPATTQSNTTTASTKTTEKAPADETYTDLGEFRITAYCSCEECCGYWATIRPTGADGKPIVYTASQEIAKAGVTVAADTSILPFGTKILIDGEEYIVQDRGGAIKGKRIDIYYDSHDEAVNKGIEYKKVWVID